MAKRYSRKTQSRERNKQVILRILGKSSKNRHIFLAPFSDFQEKTGDNFMAVCRTEPRKLTGWTTKALADKAANDHQSNTFHEVTVRVR